MIRTIAILCLLCSGVGLFTLWQFNRQVPSLSQAQLQTSETTDDSQPIPIPQITITVLPNPVIQNASIENLIIEDPNVETPVSQTEYASPAESSSLDQIPATEAANTTPETTLAQHTTVEETQETVTETTTCSSADQAGLSAAFERELGTFLNNATATYGSQYSNLQYTVSNQQITQEGELGTVSANYQGSVTEIATGQAISASGGMTVNFSWDGCYWQMVDYSYF
jgi:hypothetical protein